MTLRLFIQLAKWFFEYLFTFRAYITFLLLFRVANTPFLGARFDFEEIIVIFLVIKGESYTLRFLVQNFLIAIIM